MTPAAVLGPLNAIQERMRQILGSVPDTDVHRRFHPELASLGWYLGRTVYRESYWLDEVLREDDDICSRVRHLFGPGALGTDAQCAALPPPDHLLAWAHQVQDEHLRRLATPGQLPDHPLLGDQRLQWFLLQEAAKDYERMLAVLLQRRLREPSTGLRADKTLTPQTPSDNSQVVHQGHYRIGSRAEPPAYDNELPLQAVELSGFRIATQPVRNAEFLGFMEADGYRDPAHWTDVGWRWREEAAATHPDHWRQDDRGRWYAVGLNGPVDLIADQPVAGLSRHEALAFAAWASSLGGPLAGCVLQHEYQWEVAARAGLLEDAGQIWEWCSNPFHAYPEFAPFPDAGTSEAFFGEGYGTLRGGCLHTQPVLRRASLRYWTAPEYHAGFSGLRLVFPPSD